jgi:predicted transcriptional regulator of viral defense system
MTNDKIINPNEIGGLELAKYILHRLVNDQHTIEEVAKDYDNDKRYILGIVDFLKEVGWIKREENGTYKITRRGKENTITRHKSLVSFSKNIDITDI